MEIHLRKAYPLSVEMIIRFINLYWIKEVEAKKEVLNKLPSTSIEQFCYYMSIDFPSNYRSMEKKTRF